MPSTNGSKRAPCISSASNRSNTKPVSLRRSNMYIWWINPWLATVKHWQRTQITQLMVTGCRMLITGADAGVTSLRRAPLSLGRDVSRSAADACRRVDFSIYGPFHTHKFLGITVRYDMHGICLFLLCLWETEKKKLAKIYLNKTNRIINFIILYLVSFFFIL